MSEKHPDSKSNIECYDVQMTILYLLNDATYRMTNISDTTCLLIDKAVYEVYILL